MAAGHGVPQRLGHFVAQRRNQPAAATSIQFVLLIVVVAGVLQIVGWLSSTSDDFAGTPQFRTWAGLGGLTAAVWAAAFVAGHVHVHDVAARDRDGERREHPYKNYGLWAAFLAIVVLCLMLLLGGGSGFDVPLAHWWVLRLLIPMLGIAAAVPWIIIVWWTHDDLATLKAEVRETAAPETAPDTRPSSMPVQSSTDDSFTNLEQHRDKLNRFREAWTSIERSTGALAAIVTMGVLTTGALRLAIDADRFEHPAAKVPSQEDVLAYGLFFAALVATVVVPLILSYRRRAREFLDTVYRPERRVSESEQASVLAALLQLTSGPLVSPWALIGVLTPLVASGVAVYLPGLGG